MGMILSPVDGLSHSVGEFIEPSHCEAGTQVLLDTLFGSIEVCDLSIIARDPATADSVWRWPVFTLPSVDCLTSVPESEL